MFISNVTPRGGLAASRSSTFSGASMKGPVQRATNCGNNRKQLVVKAETDPLLVRAMKGEAVERAPAWMMRQAGRYQVAYRNLAKKHPSFRERSENTDLIVEITLQPWKSFNCDGLILFSDILTPMSAFGVEFDIDDNKGPVLPTPITDKDGLKVLHDIDLDKLHYVGESLSILRKEVGPDYAVLGFVGSPWTLATYIVEGGSTRIYKNVKCMMYQQPEVLKGILKHVAKQLAEYMCYQIESGAQCVQIFDSWGGQLTPKDWEEYSKPYIQMMVKHVKAKHPDVPLTLYANGSGGLLERMKTTEVDCIGLDWTVDAADARKRLGNDIALQGNVDPIILFSNQQAIEAEVKRCTQAAKATSGSGPRHVLNLGHGVIVGTPEENVKHFFDAARNAKY